MKQLILAGLLIFCCCFSYAQDKKIDSLDKLIANATSDTQKINLSLQKVSVLRNINRDSAIELGNKIIKEAKSIGYVKGEAATRINLAANYCFKGEYGLAKEYLDISKQLLSNTKDSALLSEMYGKYGMMLSMQNKFDSSHTFYMQGIAIAEKIKAVKGLSTMLQNNAIAYQQQSDYAHALQYYQKALQISEQAKDEEGAVYIYLNIAITYQSLKDVDRAEKSYFKAIPIAKRLNLKNVLAYTYANLSALYEDMKRYKDQYEYGMQAAALGKETGDQGIEAASLSRSALALANENKFAEAESISRQSIDIGISSKQPYNIYQTYSTMGIILRMQNQYSKAIPYFQKALAQLTDADLYDAEVGDSYAGLSECYEKTGSYSKALATYKISTKILDSITSKENVRKSTELTLNSEFQKKQQLQKEEQERKDGIAQKAKNQQRLVISILAILISAVVVISIIQYKNNTQKQKANEQLHQQKQKVENTLTELKSTQAQLIQAEKMASLGELTAGIAHEIQNPLNFVNNFSEVNTELIDELREEANKGNLDQVKVIVNDIRANEQKIIYHGKRADAIVKNMLQHSRSSSSQKEPTDINALAEEYLRLSYHGMRAKDKMFNATLKTELEETILKVNIIPQDIGRVLLNLYNNAFYAVNEKQKDPYPLKGEQYEPTVSVRTKSVKSPSGDLGVLISVTDNGNGIPQTIKDKIFQPFFTTKPTGSGTGLGLSLSYDIIKAHGGELSAETREGEGSEFSIRLPV